MLHFTVFGRYVYAIGGNRDAADTPASTSSGSRRSTYVISAGLAGVAGICYAAYIGQMCQQVGIAYELYAIAAAVLGGCSLRGGEGTVLGIIIGSAIMRVIDNGINMFQFLYRDARRHPPDLAARPELDLHHHRRRDPRGGRARPGRPHRPGPPAHPPGRRGGGCRAGLHRRRPGSSPSPVAAAAPAEAERVAAAPAGGRTRDARLIRGLGSECVLVTRAFQPVPECAWSR